MKQIGHLILPPELEKAEQKVIKLEYITLIYLFSVVVLMYLVMGNSQAMKTAWLEDLLGMIPAIMYLISVRHYNDPPNKKFPFGYQRNFGIAFLAGSVALLAMGLYLFIDSTVALIKVDKPTIGSMYIFGGQIWLGWVMIAVLLYSAIPAMILGYKKLPLAKKLHNKILFTDADAQKADYLTGFAAMVGITGVGIGWWWADSVSAVIISLSIIKDGFTNLRNAVFDLMDRHPQHVDGSAPDKLVEDFRNHFSAFPWVKEVSVRFRECGQVYIGDAYVVANDSVADPSKIESAIHELENFDWKIRDITLTVVNALPEELNN